MLILNDKIKALVVEPYKEPYEVLLDNSLKSNKYKERFGKKSIRKTEIVIEKLFNKKNRER